MSHAETSRELSQNIQVKIHNFGPITDGTISIKPLTILIGPNNSGKSYTAMLIYSLLQCHSLNKRGLSSTNIYYSLYQSTTANEFSYKYPETKKGFDKLVQEGSFSIPLDILDNISTFVSDIIYRSRLPYEIQRSFG
jgi:AAA ATPase domain